MAAARSAVKALAEESLAAFVAERGNYFPPPLFPERSEEFRNAKRASSCVELARIKAHFGYVEETMARAARTFGIGPAEWGAK